MAQIIDGKAVSASVKAEVAEEAARLKETNGLKVGLAVVIVGNDSASRVYVNNKKKACEAVGFQSFEYALDEAISARNKKFNPINIATIEAAYSKDYDIKG